MNRPAHIPNDAALARSDRMVQIVDAAGVLFVIFGTIAVIVMGFLSA